MVKYAILNTDIKGIVVNCSKEVVQLTGYTSDELAGKDFRLLFIDGKKENTFSLLLDLACQSGEASYRGAIQKNDGSNTLSDLTITPLLTDNSISGFSIVIDAADAARLSDAENLNILINHAQDMMWSVDLQYRLITCNVLFEKMFQRRAGREVMKGIDILPAAMDDIQRLRFKENYDRAFNGEEVIDVLYIAAPQETWSEISMSPIYIDGKITGAACAAHNITDRKIAEKKLTHNELRYKQAQRIANVGSWELDLMTGDAMWSEEALRIYGLEPGEYLQSYHSWLSFIHPDDKERVLQEIEASADLGMTSAYFRIVRRDGTIRHIHSTSRLEMDDAGQPVGVYGVDQDVTLLKETEEQLQAVNRLYSFTSRINQTIAHVSSEEVLFNEVCSIAVSVGGFEWAWIGCIDTKESTLSMVAQNNAEEPDLEMFWNMKYAPDGPTDTVIKNENHYIIQDFQEPEVAAKWRAYAEVKGVRSAIALPIKRAGKVVYIINLYAKKAGFFNAEEVALLQEAAKDISFALDIFEKERSRIEAKSRLHKSELRLQESQRIAKIGSWEADIHSRKVIWTKEIYRIFETDDSGFKGTLASFLSFVHPDDRDRVNKAFIMSLAGTRSNTIEHRIITGQGNIKYIEKHWKIFPGENGTPAKAIGSSQDITERKLAEEALNQSQANLSLIIDLIPVAIFVKNETGRFEFVNKRFADLYGKTPDQLIDLQIENTIPANNFPEHFVGEDQEVIRTGSTKVIPELSFVDHTGKERFFYSTKVPFAIPGSDRKAVLGIAQEITEQKLADAERIIMIADIVQRNKDLEQFSYVVSHNLRAPVANIIGITDLLLLVEQDREEEKKMLADLSVSVNKLDDVIRDLNHVLQVKRVVNEQREWVRLSDVFHDVKAGIQQVSNIDEVEVITDFSDADQLLTIKNYIHNIFFDLLSNSIKYRQQGIKTVIEIKAVQTDKMIELTFKDNGLGIDLKRKRTQMFGLYKRFHDNIEGKGMGLYMVKTQVEILGGSISVQSEVNNGTTFTILFEKH